MAESVFFEDIEVGAVIRFGQVEASREETIDFATKYDSPAFQSRR